MIAVIYRPKEPNRQYPQQQRAEVLPAANGDGEIALPAEMIQSASRPADPAFISDRANQLFHISDAKRKAIDYACGRFGGGAGEVHVYGDGSATMERKIVIDGRGRGQYPRDASD